MKDETAWDLSKHRLERSAQNLVAACVCLDNGLYDTAVNRSYYAIFHAIRSVLALDDVEFRKHSAVISYFNREYLAAKIIDRAYSELIKAASSERNSGDYDDYFETQRADAEKITQETEEFCQSIRTYVLDRIEKESEESES